MTTALTHLSAEQGSVLYCGTTPPCVQLQEALSFRHLGPVRIRPW